jgi:hypothetical protein
LKKWGFLSGNMYGVLIVDLLKAVTLTHNLAVKNGYSTHLRNASLGRYTLGGGKLISLDEFVAVVRTAVVKAGRVNSNAISESHLRCRDGNGMWQSDGATATDCSRRC